jgi:hypothetical protein
MPPRGIKKGTKRARQYEKIKRSARSRGASTSRAKEMAARTVNRNRTSSGESRTSTRSSKTKEQLYKQARRLRIEGRSSMNKSQLQRAVAAKSR